MATTEYTKTMASLYSQKPDMQKMRFLSSFFKTRPEDFTDSDKIAIDTIKRAAHIAPVVRPLSGGAVHVGEDVFTGTEVRPPLYSLDVPVNIYDLIKRQPGQNEYAARGEWIANLQRKLGRAFELQWDMIKVSVEQQAAQVLQDGTLTLTDEKGKAAYTLDYGMSSSHKIVPTVKWDNSGDPLKDLEKACDAIRDEGYVDATTAIFGRKAWDAFISNADVQAAVKVDGLNLGVLNPVLLDKGAKLMGYINKGAYRINLILYNAVYHPFDAVTPTPFVDTENVIVLPDIEDLDFRLMYGGIPSVGSDSQFADIVPDELVVDGTIRYTNRVYHDVKLDTFVAEVKSRPLCVPVSLDRLAVLKDVVTSSK